MTVYRIDRAIQFAAEAHAGQRRAGGLPYITHPLRVMETVSLVEHTEAMLVAAVLHDVVEDCDVTLDQVEAEFGIVVASLVEELTDEDISGNRRERLGAHNARLAEASPEAQTIKLADIIDNVRDIRTNKPEFAPKYVAEKLVQYDILTKASPAMRMRAAEALANALVHTH